MAGKVGADRFPEINRPLSPTWWASTTPRFSAITVATSPSSAPSTRGGWLLAHRHARRRGQTAPERARLGFEYLGWECAG